MDCGCYWFGSVFDTGLVWFCVLILVWFGLAFGLVLCLILALFCFVYNTGLAWYGFVVSTGLVLCLILVWFGFVFDTGFVWFCV